MADMPENTLREKLDAIALDVSLCDFVDSVDQSKEIYSQLYNISENAVTFGYRNIADIVACSENIFHSSDVEKKARVLSFTVDFLSNIFRSGNASSENCSDAHVFHQELLQYVGNAGLAAQEEVSNIFFKNNNLLAEFIDNANDIFDTSEEVVLCLEKDGYDDERVQGIFRHFHTLKSEAFLLGLPLLGDAFHALEDLLEKIGSIKEVNPSAVNCLLASFDRFRLFFSQLRSDSSQVLQEKFSRVHDDVQMALHSFDRSHSEVVTNEVDVSIGEKKQFHNSQSIKVPLDKIDALVEMVGELVISQSQLRCHAAFSGFIEKSLREILAHIDHELRSLQQTAMSMRLVPIKGTFHKMARIIRDLAKVEKKKIAIVLKGEETEVDQNMAALLHDPLIHIVRNAVAHGIEFPSVRKEKGKAEEGIITISASQEGGNICIHVSDDGGGLDAGKIWEQAVEKGLVEAHATLPQKRIWYFILEHGFSTVDTLTDLSGRGVGMNVVKKNVEQLRGRIDIDSAQDAGTVFSVCVPVTLAIIEGMIIRVGNERYILPMQFIVEFSVFQRQNISHMVGGKDVYLFGEKLCEVVYLDAFFGSASAGREQENEHMAACLIDSDHGQYCFVFDEVLTQQQVVIKNLGDRFRNIAGISGGAILGNGRIGLILDVNSIAFAYGGI